MVAELYESLLQELAKALKIKELRPDKHNTCLIRKKNGMTIQIEPYERGNFLLLCIDLGVVPRGRFREEVFRESLIANGHPYPRHGVFAYSDQSEHLLLYDLLPLKDLNGEIIAAAIGPMLVKGERWREALAQNAVPVAETLTTARRAPGMFGL